MPKPNTIQDVLLQLVICEPTTLETGCWEWPGSKTGGGYGMVRFEGKAEYVHRVVFTHFCGPVPDGKELHHRCNNRPCANYEHVVPLTRKEHFDAEGRTNGYEKKTHCPAGHAYEGDNLYTYPNGRRSCRTCQRRSGREYVRKKRRDGRAAKSLLAQAVDGEGGR